MSHGAARQSSSALQPIKLLLDSYMTAAEKRGIGSGPVRATVFDEEEVGVGEQGLVADIEP